MHQEKYIEKRTHKGIEYIYYWCPGCKHAHSVPTERWNWNRDLVLPTLSPSVKHYYVHPENKQEITLCHYHLIKGVIEYCGDCQHELKGKKIALQPIPKNYGIPNDSE